MKIEVGTRVKIVNCPYGEFNGREGVVTRDEYMVTSKEGMREHTVEDGEFHLHFFKDYIEPIADTLTIEPGKYYRTRDGRKVGPMREVGYKSKWPYEDDDCFTYALDGSFSAFDGEAHDRDLIAEWTDETTRDPELTSPYGDGNHPLPDLGVRAEVKPELMDFPTMGTDQDYTPTMPSGYFRDKAVDRGIISRASDTPKTWGEMSDAEKGEIALAYVDGRGVEDMTAQGDWVDMEGTRFHDTRKYRIKPQPQRETVTLYGVNGYQGDIEFDSGRDFGDWIITFDTIDGKPPTGVFRNDNGDVIKMEEV